MGRLENGVGFETKIRWHFLFLGNHKLQLQGFFTLCYKLFYSIIMHH